MDPATGLPVRFLDRLARIVPDEHRAAVVAALCAPRAVSLRVNTLRAERDAVAAELESAGLGLRAVPWYADAWVLERGTLRELQATDAWERGAVFVQGLASMTAPLALAPRPDESVLDMAAAPGGKATQLACLMGVDAMSGEPAERRGRLLANDPGRGRFHKLRAVLAQQGADGVELSRRRGEVFGTTHASRFDAVLLDAPCSADARLHPESASDWSPRRIPRLAGLQGRLLRSALAATRVGGRVVYATCTFAPEENEAVVDRVLAADAGTVELEPLDERQLPAALPGLAGWGRREFHPSLGLTRRLLPGEGVEGFFLARLRRIG